MMDKNKVQSALAYMNMSVDEFYVKAMAGWKMSPPTPVEHVLESSDRIASHPLMDSTPMWKLLGYTSELEFRREWG